jgi:PAS domain S-box-containing protein
MTEMNGYEICKRLKADDKLKDIPIIFIIDNPEIVDKLKVFSIGGKDYITKPFQFEEVQTRIKTQIELRHLQIIEEKHSTESLLYNEEGQRFLFNHLQIGILVYTSEARLILHNPLAAKLLEIPIELINGEATINDALCFCHENGSRLSIEEYPINRVINTHTPVENYIMVVNRPIAGDKIWMMVNAFPQFDSQQNLQQVVVTLLDITERKQSELAMRNSQEQLKQFAIHINTAREEEKVVLARELHDNVGQILIAIKIDLGLLKQKFSIRNQNINSVEILEDIQNIYVLMDNTIKTVRKLIMELWP